MTDIAEVAEVAAQPQIAEGVRNEVVITVEGEDTIIPMDSLGLNIDSAERDILNAIRPVMRERRNLDIADDDGEYTYTIRRARNSQTLYIYPKPVAG